MVWHIKTLTEQYDHYTGVAYYDDSKKDTLKCVVFVVQHNAPDARSFTELCHWHARCRHAYWSYCPFLYNKSHFRSSGSTSNRPHNRRPCVTTPAQDHHIRLLQLWDWQMLKEKKYCCYDYCYDSLCLYSLNAFPFSCTRAATPPSFADTQTCPSAVCV